MIGPRAVRLVATGVWAAALVLVPVAGWAADEPTPGPNPLKLPVERLEHAEQKDVRGDPASAMLFNTKDSGRLAAAQQASEQARAAQVSELFVTTSGAWVPAELTSDLFAPSGYKVATTTSTTVGGDAADRAAGDGAGGLWVSDGWWLAAGAGVLLAGGAVASARMRARNRIE